MPKTLAIQADAAFPQIICLACEIGPRGTDGHPEISLLHQADRKHFATFACRACGQKYTRTWEGAGMFIWLRVEEPALTKARA